MKYSCAVFSCQDDRRIAERIAKVWGKVDKTRILSPAFPTNNPRHKGTWRVAIRSIVYNPDKLSGMLYGTWVGFLYEGME